jgi:hypothetical protein
MFGGRGMAAGNRKEGTDTQDAHGGQGGITHDVLRGKLGDFENLDISTAPDNGKLRERCTSKETAGKQSVPMQHLPVLPRRSVEGAVL